jgi:hypothetical protein
VNRAPVANAGSTATVDERTVVRLDGTGSSDADGDALTYTWTQTSGPSVTLAGADTANPTFTAPEVTADTTLAFSLVVSDGAASSSASTVDVDIHNVNRAPVADAGSDIATHGEAAVTLDGSRSSEPDGEALAYEWSQTDGPTVTLTGANTATATFTAPKQIKDDQVLKFSLTVTDPSGAAHTDAVQVTVFGPGGCGCGSAGGGVQLASGMLLLALIRARRRGQA